jgi:hypothetical protein
LDPDVGVAAGVGEFESIDNIRVCRTVEDVMECKVEMGWVT